MSIPRRSPARSPGNGDCSPDNGWTVRDVSRRSIEARRGSLRNLCQERLEALRRHEG